MGRAAGEKSAPCSGEMNLDLFDADNQMGRDPQFIGGAYVDVDLDGAVGYGPAGRMTRAQLRELHGPMGPGPGRDMVGGARRTRRRKNRKERKSRKSRSRLRSGLRSGK
jgi:hypothetical protein